MQKEVEASFIASRALTPQEIEQVTGALNYSDDDKINTYTCNQHGECTWCTKDD